MAQSALRRWRTHTVLGLVAVLLGGAACAPPGPPVSGSASTPTAPTASAASATPVPPRSCPVLSAAALVPDSGALFGVSVDWSHDSLAAYAARLGQAPAVAVTFSGLPMTEKERLWTGQAADQAAAQGSTLLLTLEPLHGLDTVTTAVADDLAGQLDVYNRRGVPVIVRFAHEMNGSWYAWGQDPRGYVAAFRRVATAVHRDAPGSAMMWAPNYGGGYPFAGGKYEAKPRTRARTLLDTDHDGRVDGTDDPYAPYWPGRAAVDWVGMSLYHWGNRYPWGENEVPEAGKFVDLLHGTYDGLGGDETAVPDFYHRYGQQLKIPVAVTETAAFYAPGAGGPSELAVKRAWWKEVFAADVARTLPQLKMVNWFEWDKREVEVKATVHWTVTRSDTTHQAYRNALPRWAHFAPGTPRC